MSFPLIPNIMLLSTWHVEQKMEILLLWEVKDTSNMESALLYAPMQTPVFLLTLNSDQAT